MSQAPMEQDAKQMQIAVELAGKQRATCEGLKSACMVLAAQVACL